MSQQFRCDRCGKLGEGAASAFGHRYVSPQGWVSLGIHSNETDVSLDICGECLPQIIDAGGLALALKKLESARGPRHIHGMVLDPEFGAEDPLGTHTLHPTHPRPRPTGPGRFTR
jgi:hypothetical protein